MIHLKKLLLSTLVFWTFLAHSNSALIIGDSLSAGPFGESFFSCLKNSGHFNQLHAEASCGSRPAHWAAQTPTYVSKCGYVQRKWNTNMDNTKTDTTSRKVKNLNDLYPNIDVDQNSWTVFQLGTNNFGDLKSSINHPVKLKSATARVRAEISKLVSQRRTKNCYWILPPAAASNTHKPNGLKYKYVVSEEAQTHLKKILIEEMRLAGCDFYDSSLDIPTFNDLNDDGFHFYSSEGRIRAERWANSACQTLVKKSGKTVQELKKTPNH